MIMNQPPPIAENSLWSPGKRNFGRRHLRGGVRSVKFDDKQIRILPKYRRRRRQLAADWSSVVHGSDDAITTLNSNDVHPLVTPARRWTDETRTVGETGLARSSGEVFAGRREVQSSAATLQPVTAVSDNEDTGDDKVNERTAPEFSGSEEYDADDDEELNASSRLMLSRIIASKLRSALPSSVARENSRIDDDDDDDADDATVRQRTKRQRVASCCRSFVSFLASTIGLTCLLVVYTLLGGVLFVGLEAQHERHVKTAIMTTRDEYVRQLWHITKRLNVLHADNWSALADQLLTRYADEVYVATKVRGWDGRQHDDDGEQQWSFAGALLYSITVVTTIGTPVAAAHVALELELVLITWNCIIRRQT